MAESRSPSLAARALARGVQSSWVDTAGRTHEVPEATLEAILHGLGAAPPRSAAVPPVVVAWDGAVEPVPIDVAGGGRGVQAHLELDDGSDRPVAVLGGDAATLGLPSGLPAGRHRLHLRLGAEEHTADVLSAPRRCHPGAGGDHARQWGVFHPTATLWSDRSRCVGDVGDLGRLARWAEAHGATVVGTLPLLAAFPDDPSPYAPVSRLFWNEAYVDLDAVPSEWWDAAGVGGADLAPRQPGRLVDQASALRVRHPPLAALGRWLEGAGRTSRAGMELADFLDGRPELADYARFRACGERHGRNWRDWPAPASADADAAGAHLVGQWLMHRQLAALSGQMAARGQSLYLDLPIGCHGDGYDVWRHPELFAPGVDGGAPPDAFFAEGQSWGFPPLRPDAGAIDRWRYLEACLDTQMAVAGHLRLDHVMGLRRMFWVPHGSTAADGAYVHLPVDELLAVVSMVSHRHGTAVVGEDLGTVPEEVSRLMATHRLRSMYVVEFEIRPAAPDPLIPVPPDAVASIGTHDLPTLSGWWAGRDLRARLDLGQTDAAGAEELMDERVASRRALAHALIGPPSGDGDALPGALLGAVLDRLGSSPAGLVLVDVADLWGEPEQVNLPGTGPDQRPNWRRRSPVPVDHLDELEGVDELLRRLARARAVAAATGTDTVSR